MGIILQVVPLPQFYPINPGRMRTTPLLTKYSKDEENAVFLPMKMTETAELNGFAFLSGVDLKPKKIYKPYYKFYTVYKNETAVTQVSTNDFKPFQPACLKIKAACRTNSKKHPAFSNPVDDPMANRFISRVKAMEFAKAGALKYISRLIDEGEKGFNLLIAYREAHYEDLNFNLTEKNISNIGLN